MNDESNIQVFQTYLEDVMKTSTQVRLRTREMIVNNNNVDVPPSPSLERSKSVQTLFSRTSSPSCLNARSRRT